MQFLPEAQTGKEGAGVGFSKSWRIHQGNAIFAVYSLPFELGEIRHHRLVKKEGVVCPCLYQKIGESYWKKLS